MHGVIDDIEEYNKRFSEQTKNYKKFCEGKECEYIDKCDKKGKIVFCQRDDEENILYYIKSRHDSGIFSFKDVCRRDGFPNGGMNMKMLNELWGNVKEKLPEILPNSIDVWVEELKEIGMFKEEWKCMSS